MLKIIKYKILNIVEDNFFKILIVFFFLILNYNVFMKSGILSVGSREFNKSLKYALLVNNFLIFSNSFGLFISLYIGNGLIGKDISSGKLYITLVSCPSRTKYLIGNFVSLIIVIITFLVFIFCNYLICATLFDIEIMYHETLNCFLQLFVNMIVIMTITSIASLFMYGKTSLVAGIVALTLFEIYTFKCLPFLQYVFKLKLPIRRILACLCPMRNVSIITQYDLREIVQDTMIHPYIINNMTLYQLVYILVIATVGILYFRRKEI